ncbi:MAG: threonylcarbamoyl-AMP synthase [Cytophagales bacterium]|nr:MAG: threonylcarbamoyl-AMP synthase [Cytophagales bacterium]TAF60016.1 MAG: threonylcarbamoyl-AMP synthase [Cytophagales bacterium]
MRIGQDILQAAHCLKLGQLVGVPTETVYGLAANACAESAVISIFEAKKRPAFDPLIVHFASFEAAKAYVDLSNWSEKRLAELSSLAQNFMPGPLTVLLPKSDKIPPLVTSGLAHVGVRVPQHKLLQELLSNLPFPLAAPSANPFGYISPTTAQHVAEQLGSEVAYILDGGACEVGLESTVLGLDNDVWTVFRKGGLQIENIEAVLGSVRVLAHSSSSPQAPGMLKSHYAPLKPLTLLHRSEVITQDEALSGTFFLLFENKIKHFEDQRQILLSPNGSLNEAAQKLFAVMRELDANPHCQRIIAEYFPEEGLGLAINDRLRRAAAKA